MESITPELQTGSGSTLICMPGAGKVKGEQKIRYQGIHIWLAASRRVRGREGHSEGEGNHFTAGKCITQVVSVL